MACTLLWEQEVDLYSNKVKVTCYNIHVKSIVLSATVLQVKVTYW